MPKRINLSNIIMEKGKFQYFNNSIKIAKVTVLPHRNEKKNLGTNIKANNDKCKEKSNERNELKTKIEPSIGVLSKKNNDYMNITSNKNDSVINLRNIKSKYILEIIFSFMKENEKLNIIKYSKCYQKIFEIDLEYYKLKSGKYIIKGEDGKVREYTLFDKLIFEGEYLNGKRNGIGKEFKGKFLLFEGEYLNGKRNGKGTEYDEISRGIKFEGEYLNGKKWTGRGYHPRNKILEYVLINGNGKVKDFQGDNLVYEGQFLNGERNGKGKEYYLESYNSIKFEGEYLNDKRNGKGKEYYSNGDLMFEGDFLNDKRWNGKGSEYHPYSTNIKYEGEYLNGKRNGKGKEYYSNGKLKFEGEYLRGLKWTGIGYDIANKEVYELKQGGGLVKEYDDSGKLIFEGEYLNGQRWNGTYFELSYYGELKSTHYYLRGKVK